MSKGTYELNDDFEDFDDPDALAGHVIKQPPSYDDEVKVPTGRTETIPRRRNVGATTSTKVHEPVRVSDTVSTYPAQPDQQLQVCICAFVSVCLCVCVCVWLCEV